MGIKSEVLQDITGRKQVEEALRESEERFRIAFHTSPDSININRLSDGMYLEVNEGFQRIMGYERDEVIGRTSLELDIWVDTNDRSRLREGIKAHGLVENMEAKFRRKDGLICSGLMSASTLYIGEELCILSITRNITEHRQAEEALRILAESSDTSRGDIFQTIVRQLAVSQSKRYAFISEIDEGNINTAYTVAVWSNGGLAENFSYSLEETPCYKAAYENICFYPRDVQQLFPKDHLLTEMEAESYWGAPLRSIAGNIIGVMAIVDDRPMEKSLQTLSLLNSFAIRAAAEMERNSMERKYRALFASMVQGVVYQNGEGKIISANPAAERILGLTLDQLQGRTSIDPRWRALNKDGSVFPGAAHPAMVSLQTGEAIKNIIMGVFNPINDTYSWINVNSTPLFRSNEKRPHQVYTTFEDITERIEIEQKNANYAIQLEKLYNQLDEEMDKARKVHERILPENLPEVEGISMATYYKPAKKLGGDLYDVIQIGNKLIFYLSDVSGHGLDGAMLSVFVKEAIYGYVTLKPDEIQPHKILYHLDNQYRRGNHPGNYFICIFLSVLDLETMELTYSAAGFQDTPLVRMGNGDNIRLTSKGLFICSAFHQDKMKFYEESISLTPGTTLLFNTDGLAEQGAKGEYYRSRLANIFYQNAFLPPKLIVQAICEDFRQFNNDSLQGKDDITFLVLQVEPQENKIYRLELASNFGELKRLRKEAKNLIANMENGETVITGLQEMVSNAIEHGNKFDPEKIVTVEISIGNGYFQATVKDQGNGFNWREKIEKPLDLFGNSDRGRGIAMTRICCEEISYNDKGNQVMFSLKTLKVKEVTN